MLHSSDIFSNLYPVHTITITTTIITIAES